jgi:dolichyl-diphosphooligosaccharide--protein glycosyltransferase
MPTTVTTLRRWIPLAVVLASVAAFCLRVVPLYDRVFMPAGVNFQVNDAWYHARGQQSLAAHFPHRSGFDPYAVYPGGQAVVTGPLWDYMIATPAWLIGAVSPSRSPSPRTVEMVAAWMPALLGALFPPLVFWLARLLFDDLTGVFAAWWIALLPGVLLWMSRLGADDHHAAESFLALLAWGLVCKASESGIVDRPEVGQASLPAAFRIKARKSGRQGCLPHLSSVLFTLAAGVALGAYFANRPAGIFLVGILVVAALLDPVLAPIGAGALTVAAILFLPLSGTQWAGETWTALGGGIAATLALSAVARLWRIKRWSAVSRLAANAALVAAAVAFAWLIRPSLFVFLRFQFQRAAGQTGNVVGELQPLLHWGQGSTWEILLAQFGTSWILAFPALVALIYLAWKENRPPLTLFAVWSVVMTAGAFAQVRMAVYLLVNLAILAAVASSWVMRFSARRAVRIAATVVVVLCLAANLPRAWKELQLTTEPSPEWHAALAWLRTQSPEPLGDSAAWTALYPALESGRQFSYPQQAYSVAVWWDFGYWVEYLARRIPSSNGTQAGVEQTARFYAEIDAANAMARLDRMGSRYVVVDPSVGGGGDNSIVLSILEAGGRPVKPYLRIFLQDGRPVIVYLPSYYESMAVRLYLYDGGPAIANAGTWVLHGRNLTGQLYPTLDFARQFPTQQEAREFLQGRPPQGYVIGGLDPSASFIPLDGVPGLRLVYSSGGPGSVKVFERVR